MNLKNKKILITGATGGIGNCIVEKFNNLGSLILATGTNEEKLDNCHLIKQLGSFLKPTTYVYC